jgi:large subunit ribosomal protein L29
MKSKTDYRDTDDHDIQQKLKEIDDQMFRLKFQMSMGQMDGLKKVRQMKKDRARMLTVRRQRTIAAAQPAGEKK